MKSKTDSNIDAKAEAAVNDVATPLVSNHEGEDSADGEMWFDVNPNEIVSIVAGNRTLMLRRGVTGILVHYDAGR